MPFDLRDIFSCVSNGGHFPQSTKASHFRKLDSKRKGISFVWESDSTKLVRTSHLIGSVQRVQRLKLGTRQEGRLKGTEEKIV